MSSLLSRVIGLGGLSLQITPCPGHNGLYFFAMLHPTKIEEGYKAPTFYPTLGITEYDTPEYFKHLHRVLWPEDHSRPWYPVGIYKNAQEALEGLESHIEMSLYDLSLTRYNAAVQALGRHYFKADPELQKKWRTPPLDRVVQHKDKPWDELFTGQPMERHDHW